MILEACPDVALYAGGSRITNWPEFVTATRLIAPMLGISRDALHEADTVFGPKTLAIVIATILQRSEHSSEARTIEGKDGYSGVVVNGSPAIRSAGGYLRALTAKARTGDFAAGPILMSLIGQRLKARIPKQGDRSE